MVEDFYDLDPVQDGESQLTDYFGEEPERSLAADYSALQEDLLKGSSNIAARSVKCRSPSFFIYIDRNRTPTKPNKIATPQTQIPGLIHPPQKSLTTVLALPLRLSTRKALQQLTSIAPPLESGAIGGQVSHFPLILQPGKWET